MSLGGGNRRGQPGGALELTGLRNYGDVVALDGLIFTVPHGQVFGSPRAERAGKTTAMRATVGVASLDRGSVRCGGRHQLDLIEQLCTSVAIIHRGTLVAGKLSRAAPAGGRCAAAPVVTALRTDLEGRFTGS